MRPNVRLPDGRFRMNCQTEGCDASIESDPGRGMVGCVLKSIPLGWGTDDDGMDACPLHNTEIDTRGGPAGLRAAAHQDVTLPERYSVARGAGLIARNDGAPAAPTDGEEGRAATVEGNPAGPPRVST